MSTPTDLDHHAAVRRLFEQAAALPPSDRRPLLDAAPPAVRAEAEALLRHHDADLALLDRPPADLFSTAAPAPNTADNASTTSAPTPAQLAHELEHGHFPPGTHIGPPAAGYTLRELIGRDGLGATYLAEHDRSRRALALRLIRADLTTDAMARRFELLAPKLTALDHPAIPRIHAAGAITINTIDRPFLATDPTPTPQFIPLTDHIAAAGPRFGPIARTRLVIHLCDVIQHLHNRGLTHLDLDPGCILISSDNQRTSLRPRILNAAWADLTGPPTAPRAPEQSAATTTIDARADVYALAAVLHELLTQRRPPAAASSSAPTPRAQVAPFLPALRLPRALARDLRAILEVALAPDPAHRYQSPSELAADVRRALADEPTSARPDTHTATLARALRRRNPWLITLLATTALLVGALIKLLLTLNP